MASPTEETPVLGPGDSTTIALSVIKCDDNGMEENTTSYDPTAEEDVEYTVVVVDKATLELIPYDLQDIAKDFIFDLAGEFSSSSSSDYLYAPGVPTALVEKFIRQQEENPWDYIDSIVSVRFSIGT